MTRNYIITKTVNGCTYYLKIEHDGLNDIIEWRGLRDHATLFTEAQAINMAAKLLDKNQDVIHQKI